MTGESSLSGRSLEGAEREQRLLAEELHETLCQTLVGVSFISQILLRNKKAGKAIDISDLKKISRYVDEAVDQTRLIFQDQSILFGAVDLGTALEKLAAVVSKRTTCEFQCGKLAKITSPKISHALYRIAREAVGNALRHSQSRKIVIILTKKKDESSLTIRDDGYGFKKTVSSEKPLRGFQVMEGYAKSIKGKLFIRSIPGKETCVRCTVSINN
jgi:signal transduction histidine kinase